MRIYITIDNCESISDFYAHLAELKRQIKKESRRLKLDPIKDEFPSKVGVALEDANCYGEHYVKIIHPRV